ncbi:MAG: hypothetical protein R3C97_17100 [Geminicoccaceae bacterium]
MLSGRIWPNDRMGGGSLKCDSIILARNGLFSYICHMSEPTHHSRPTPRAFVLLAHHVEDGLGVAEAARLSGVDPALAERLVRNWAFILLMRIIPFFRIKVAPRSSSAGRKIVVDPERMPLPPAVKRLFSLYIRCKETQDAGDSDADASENEGANDRALANREESPPTSSTKPRSRTNAATATGANTGIARISRPAETAKTAVRETPITIGSSLHTAPDAAFFVFSKISA